MFRSALKKAVSLLTVIVLIFITYINIFALNETSSLIEGTVDYICKGSEVQQALDGSFASQAGQGSEWYVLALRQYNSQYDFSSYCTALKKYVDETDVPNAVTREKNALLLAATGYTGSDISATLESSIGKLGIMSWVFALHLMNNGYSCDSYTKDDVINTLLEKRCADGGWAITGTTSDIDATAMVLQSLAPSYSDEAVKNVADEAVGLLSSRQKESGGFVSYGVENLESTAQVIIALCSLNIDCISDSRFIKNGITLLDVLKSYRLSDGSFSHTTDTVYNENATIQALLALVSLHRYENAQGSLYLLTQPNNYVETTTQASTTAPTVIETTAVSNSVASETATAPPTTAATVTTVPSTASTSAVSEQTTVLNTENTPARTNYRAIIVCIVIALALILCLALRSHGKGGKLTYIIIAVSAAVICVLVMTTSIQGADTYYGSTENAGGDITVTLSIRCDTVAGKADNKDIPSDGIILEETQYIVSNGSTVYDVLMLASRENKIQVENDSQTLSNYSSAYITGINYLYEFDFGDLSGWVYHVNDVSPSVGCGMYTVSDGDKIEWLYSCNLGEDVK